VCRSVQTFDISPSTPCEQFDLATRHQNSFPTFAARYLLFVFTYIEQNIWRFLQKILTIFIYRFISVAYEHTFFILYHRIDIFYQIS